MSRLSNLFVAAIAALALPAQAQAQAPEEMPRWTFGLLAIDRDAPYRGLDEDPLLLPLLRYEGERAYLRGLRGGLRFGEADGFAFGPFLQLRGDGYEAKDSPFLAGMDDREFSLDAGLAASWRRERFGQIELSLATDVLDRSGGQEAELSWTGLVRAGGWSLLPQLAAKWQSADLVDYYYGVRNDEALPGRPAWQGEAALVPELSLLATRPLGARWTLFARAGHSWLPDAIRNSPIVDGDGRTTLMLGLGWSPEN
jgi:outer membrane protein